jgi:hypothetical protein
LNGLFESKTIFRKIYIPKMVMLLSSFGVSNIPESKKKILFVTAIGSSNVCELDVIRVGAFIKLVILFSNRIYDWKN